VFNQYRLDHGDLRLQVAFRAAFPNSKASDKTASNRGYELSKMGVIQGRYKEMQAQARSLNAKSFIMDVAERKRLLSNAATRCGEVCDERGVLDVRGMTATIAELNKMDGEYEKDNAQKQSLVNITLNLAGKPDE
jgi:hypothetical protein